MHLYAGAHCAAQGSKTEWEGGKKGEGREKKEGGVGRISEGWPTPRSFS